jgi:hypothetical protein
MIVIPPQFAAAGPFSDGLAAVRIGDDHTGKWGYIDKQGKMVINPQFGYYVKPSFENGLSPDFTEGLSAVRTGNEKTDKWGYIDKQGKMVINPQFDGTFGFYEGLDLPQTGHRPAAAHDPRGTRRADVQQARLVVVLGSGDRGEPLPAAREQ